MIFVGWFFPWIKINDYLLAGKSVKLALWI